MSTLSQQARDPEEIEALPDFGAPATTFDGQRHHDVPAPVLPDEPEEEVVNGVAVESIAVIPYTGECLQLRDLTDEQLAQLIDEAREFEQARMRVFKREVQDEVLRRMDDQAEWTIHAAGWKLAGDSPARTEFDVNELRAALKEAGTPEELIAKAIRPKPVEYSVSRSGVNTLLKLGGKIAEAIKTVEKPTSKPRGVRVTREGSQ